MDISSNNLTTLTSANKNTFGALTKLVASNNKLNAYSLPTADSTLQELRLEFNALQSFSNRTMNSLKVLNLNNNPSLSEFSNNSFPKITNLSISGSNLTDFTNYQFFDQLQALEIAGAKLETFSDNSFNKLERLELSGNAISKFTSNELSNAFDVNLSNNQLTRLDNTNQFRVIRTLTLTNNLFADADVIVDLKSLNINSVRTIDLRFNPNIVDAVFVQSELKKVYPQATVLV